MEATSFPALDKPESRFGIEFSAIEFSAAVQARHRPLEPADPRKFLPAPGTLVEETALPFLHGKGQGMAARFIRDAEIAASSAPLRTVRRNSPAPGSKLREQMRELMAQGAVDFRRVVFAESRIQRNEITVRIRAAGGAKEPGIPFHVNYAAEFLGAEGTENFARCRFERGIASENDERWLRGENEVELPKQRHRRYAYRR